MLVPTGGSWLLGLDNSSRDIPQMGSASRLLATGVREPGSAEFRLTIYGHAGRELPPARLLASLADFRAWIAQGQAALATAQTPGGVPLR